MDIPQLLDPPELAQRLGITVGCLAKWRLVGEGPAFLRVGRRIQYDPRDISKWLDRRRRASTSSHDD